MLAINTASFVLLIAISAIAKAFMDASKFRRGEAFLWASSKFQDFMIREGKIPIIKIDDGWHSFQMLMFACYGLAFFVAGSYEWYAFFIAVALRMVVHGAVFEFTYHRL